MAGQKPTVQVSVAKLIANIRQRIEDHRMADLKAHVDYNNAMGAWPEIVTYALEDAFHGAESGIYPQHITHYIVREGTVSGLFIPLGTYPPDKPQPSMNYEAAERDIRLLRMVGEETISIPLENSTWSKYL